MNTLQFGLPVRAPKRSQWFQKPSRKVFVLLLVVLVEGKTFAQSPPAISSVSPPDGATGVPTDSAIVFNFDQPLSLTAFPVSSTEYFTGNFRILPSYLNYYGSPSADKQTLTLQSTSPFPANTTISWTLNPANAYMPLGNASGNIATVSGSFTTAASDSPAPTILSVSPDNNATEVSPSGSITFTFDQDMDTSTILQLGTPPIFTGNYQFTPSNYGTVFEAAWGIDGRTLIFTPRIALPLGTVVGWKLNPNGTSSPLKGINDEPLVEISGSFTIIENTGGNPNELCDPTGDPVGEYLLTKVFAHTQPSANVVIPNTSPQPILNASALEGPGIPAVTGGSITTPGGANFMLDTQYGPYGYYSPRDTEAELNVAFPEGAYTFEFTQEGQTPRLIGMNMPASSTVNTAMILNYGAAQTINPSQNFTFQWNAQTLNAESQILFSISDEIGNLIFLAPNPCIPRALSPSDTAVMVPADYLKPGLKYRGLLRFGNIFYHSDSEVPDMVGIGAIWRYTTFEIQTTGSGTGSEIIPATFANFDFIDGKPTFSISGSASGSYTIRRSATIAAPIQDWAAVGTVNIDGTGSGTFTDHDANRPSTAFYQAVGN